MRVYGGWTMQFSVLGPVDAVAGERRASLGAGHQRTILAVLLAARGQTVSTGALVEALWGDVPPPTARKSVQSHVARLRRTLAAVRPAVEVDAVVPAPGGYRFRAGAHGLDATALEDAVHRARDAADPAECLERLDHVLSLARGPAFGELASHPHVRAEAVRLDRLLADARAARVTACLARGHADRVVADLEAAVVQEPVDERLHAQLMHALALCGRQADALDHYTRLRGRLREELGVDPSAALEELHGRILRHDVSMRRDGGRRKPPTTRGDRSAAPAGGLVGRDTDVRAVADLLGRHRVVTLTGPGGVGKTRLAEQVLHHATSRVTADVEVVACELAGVRDGEAVGDAMVTALGVQPTGDRTIEHALTAALGERRVLLLVDNCEHVLADAAGLVSAIVRHCPHVVVLATSRERLHLPEEHVRQVTPLEVPETTDDPDAVAATPAGALFVLRARAAERGFELTADSASAVAELCRRLDGMPLAIELAAARVRSMTPADLVARLDRRFSLLAGGPRHEAGRHRTLQAVVAWSHDLLEPDQAELFRRLSVFVGPFELVAAENVCAGWGLDAGEVAGVLGDLVDRSLVNVEHLGDQIRYRLLDTLREFAAQRLVEWEHTDALRKAHAGYHVALAEQLGPRMRGPGERDSAARIRAANDDLRSAHGWLVRTGDRGGALRLPAALDAYVFFRLHDEITTWARRAVSMPGAEEHPARAAALAAAAQGATNRDECARAHEDAMTALAHTHPDSPVALSALWAAGTAAFYVGDLDRMLPIADQLGVLAERLDEPFHGAFAGVLRVLAHGYRDDRAAAEAALAALEAAAESAGSPTMHAFAHYCRGEVHRETRPDVAIPAFERAVALARDVDNALIEGVSLVSLASLQSRSGDTGEALRLFRDVVAHWRRLGDHTHQLTTLRNLVELLARIGSDEAAAELFAAVTSADTPSFGTEAQRLDDAWADVQQRLAPASLDEAVKRGRAHSPTAMADVALSHLDAMLVSRRTS